MLGSLGMEKAGYRPCGKYLSPGLWSLNSEIQPLPPGDLQKAAESQKLWVIKESQLEPFFQSLLFIPISRSIFLLKPDKSPQRTIKCSGGRSPTHFDNLQQCIVACKQLVV